VALKGDCTVVAWGSHNHSGERSVPAGLSGVTQISVRGTHNCTTPPVGLSDVIQVASGGYHNLALVAP
jgi:hypothetical protein